MSSKAFSLALIFALAVVSLAQSASENDRPIIGVVTTPSDYASAYDPSQYSYLKASYVKWVESGGARVTPVPWNLGQSDMLALLSKVNGVVFAGGYPALTSGSGDSTYTAAVRTILNYAINQNNQGIYFPVLGIDEGFLAMALVIGNDHSLLENVQEQSTLGQLSWTSSAYTSKMYSLYPSFLIQYAQTNAISWFNTSYGISPAIWSTNSNLTSYFNILSNTYDGNGLEFVSSAEGTTLPLYGVQFHPEKAAFEWDSNTYNHEYKAIQAGQLLINRFIDESRNNFNVYPTPLTEDTCLIYNWNTTMLPNLYCPMYFFSNSAGTCLTSVSKSVKPAN